MLVHQVVIQVIVVVIVVIVIKVIIVLLVKEVKIILTIIKLTVIINSILEELLRGDWVYKYLNSKSKMFKIIRKIFKPNLLIENNKNYNK